MYMYKIKLIHSIWIKIKILLLKHKTKQTQDERGRNYISTIFRTSTNKIDLTNNNDNRSTTMKNAHIPRTISLKNNLSWVGQHVV